jgi:anthranilate phosphoribosyltransferase
MLDGEQGPVRDAVLLNAGAALAVHDAPGDDPDEALAAGLVRARESVDSGVARATLDRWVAASSA